MKSELKMQYLNLKLKISGMVDRLKSNQGTITEKQAQIEDLQQKLSEKSEELAKAKRRLKELEKKKGIFNNIIYNVINQCHN